ncbi:Serine/threonine-protein kinase PAK 5 [Cytospora paraplurivora]|uniref:non-specific serine/threonine protein kinase n=1 Tax=Cytospora paraplurivora TaxID=2898453 RepID=A0AAN9U0B6_9PEZI
MATLRVRAADPSATKKKAFEDAEKMQKCIVRECAEAGRNPPPYALSELIGKGSFGRVYKAKAAASGRLVAVKIISIDEGDSLAPGAADTFNDILKEVNTLKKLGDSGAKNINTVIETLLVGPSMWIITEYCGGGSVSTLMRPSGGLPEKWIIPILREVAVALYWVHKEGIIHRDIKCANVLITETGGVQLCDFGVAGIIETKFDKRSTVTGTLNWMAPELFDMSVSYGTEVDIWAFGSLAFEAATGLPPNAKNMSQFDPTLFGSYLKQHVPRLEGDQFSPQLKDLVACCMTEDPQDRPSISQVQRHPYIYDTERRYPTQSLSMLVNAYRLWEVQGGNRLSLFNAGGAQAPSGDEAAAFCDDGWNFDTMAGDFDQSVLGDTQAQAVYDAYGPRVSMMPPPPKQQGRRRRPPNIPALKGPLEKAFDPNTITSYEDNARLFYGRPMPSSAPEMGTEKKDGVSSEQPRESLIDLDMSLDGDRLSRFADMEGETIKASVVTSKHQTIRESGLIDLDESLDGGRLSRFADMQMQMDTIRASRQSIRPLGRSQTTLDHRRTQDWTFPGALSEEVFEEVQELQQVQHDPRRESQLGRSLSTMDHRRTQDWSFATATVRDSMLSGHPLEIARSQSSLEHRRTQDWTFSTAASSNTRLGGQWFQSHDENDEDDYMALDTLPNTMSGREPEDSLAVTLPPRAATSLEMSRFSASSMIDLDASLVGDDGESLRPSTAHSDAASATPGPWRPTLSHQSSFQFNLDDALPSSTREPSLYIPDDGIPRSNREPSLYASDEAIARSNREPSLYVADGISSNGSIASTHEREPSIYVPDDIGLGVIPSTPTSGEMMLTPPSDSANEALDDQAVQADVAITVEDSDVDSDAPMPALPYMPRPPTVSVLQGTSSQDEVKDELQRMIRSLHEHLQYTTSVLRTLPVRRGSVQGDHPLSQSEILF